MKRKYRAVLGLILAGGVCLSGCSKPGGEASAAQKLGGSFTTEMTMQMEDWTRVTGMKVHASAVAAPN